MRLLIIFASLFVFSSLVSAIDFPDPYSYSDHPVTSIQDPLFIEMPDTVHEYIPITVKVHVNDPWIRENANYIDFSGTQTIYTSDGTPYSSSLNSYIPYNGEEVLQFGMRPVGKIDSTSQIIFFFLHTKTTEEEYPDKSEGSEFHLYECNKKTWPPDSDTFCGGATCTMCYRTLGSIRRDFLVLASSSSAPVPGGFSFTDVKAEDSHYDSGNYPGYLEYGWAEDPEIGCVNRYTFRLDATTTPSQVRNYKGLQMYSHFEDTTSPGGATQGPALEYLTDTTNGPYDGVYKLNIDYQLVADLDPPGSGGIVVKAHRQGCSSSSGSAVSSEVVSAAKAFAAGYTITPALSTDYVPMPGAISKEDFTVTHVAWLPGEAAPAKPEPAPDLGATFSGRVIDAEGHPIAYSEMHLYYKGSWRGGFASGADGYYSIEVSDFNPEEKSRVSIVSFLNYMRDGKNYFLLADKWHGNKVPYLMKTFDYEGSDDLANDIDWGGPKGGGWIYHMEATSRAVKDRVEWKTNSDFTAAKMFSVIYFHTHNAVDLYLQELGVTLDYRLPIEIFVRSSKWSHYSTADSQIHIYEKHVALDHPKRRLVEQHEFSHAVMYDLYGRWPDGDYLPGNENHAGYINPSTADSYIEGFAEFMPMVIADYSGSENPHIYGGLGSLELNYRATSRRGLMEEFAIAGILWDLYDKNNDRGDTISIDLPDLWSILKVKRKDFSEYYTALVDAFPEKKAGIDTIFIEHGFFADKNLGNGKLDYNEPRRSATDFIDLGSTSSLPAAVFYDQGETVGHATNYQRPTRGLELEYPDSYLKVPETNCLLYTVSVDLEDAQDGQDFSYTTMQSGGLIYITPLPDHIAATITVEPGQGFFGTKYEITNEQYSDKLYSSDGKGYFDEHIFNLIPDGTAPEINETYWGHAKDGGYKGDSVEVSVMPDLSDPEGVAASPAVGSDGKPQPTQGNDISGIIITIVVIAIASFAFFYVRSRPKGITVNTSAKAASQTPAKTVYDSKFCHNCGLRLAAEDEFCHNCGQKQ